MDEALRVLAGWRLSNLATGWEKKKRIAVQQPRDNVNYDLVGFARFWTRAGPGRPNFKAVHFVKSSGIFWLVPPTKKSPRSIFNTRGGRGRYRAASAVEG